MTEIGDHAFEECKKLKKIVIPDSVKKMGSDVFRDCDHLTDITLSESLKVVKGFIGCKALTNIVIPKAVKTIDRYAFYGCTALESVTFCGSVKEIDKTAFMDHTGIGLIPNQALKVINVPAKKGDYYKSLLPEALHKFVVELPAGNKA